MHIIGWLILPAIIYFVVQAAVREGVYKGLIDYENYKDKKNEDS